MNRQSGILSSSSALVPLLRNLFTLALLCIALAPPGLSQTPPEERLEQDNIQPEQLPGTIRRALDAKKPSPEIQATVNELVRKAEAHYSAGEMGMTSRWLFHALAKIVGREWSPRDDYWRSLVLRTDMTVLDPSRPLIVRLEQIYASSYEPDLPLSIQATFRDLSDPATAKELGTDQAYATNFRDQPHSLPVDLDGCSPGSHRVQLEIHEAGRHLRRLSTSIWVVPGFDARRENVTRQLQDIRGHESAKASIRYPFDLALRVNLRKVEARDYDFLSHISAAEELLQQLKEGHDPVYRAVGDQKRHYWFEEADEIMPYRINVPATYDGTRPFPLIVMLHGNGGTDDTMMDVMNGLLKTETEKRGYVVVSPMGYRPSGGYGRVRAQGVSFGAFRRRIAQLSEQDVLQVLATVRSEYRIDENRIYLMGVSMGGGGTWTLANLHPEIWTAIAPMSAGVVPSEIDWERIRHIPVIVSHGDADATVPVEHSRAMVAKMRELGMTFEHGEIVGGGHRIFRRPLAASLDFFAQHRRKRSN